MCFCGSVCQCLLSIFANEIEKHFRDLLMFIQNCHAAFFLHNNLFDYKVNHSHPLTLRLNYPAMTGSPQSVFAHWHLCVLC